MAAAPKALARTTLTTSSASLYVVPASTTAIITNIILVNSTATAATATLSLDGVVLVPTVSIAANSLYTIDLRQALATTKTITGQASSAAAISVHISGAEQT